MDEIISDRELIKLFLSRDDTALELAMKKYKNRLMRFASRFLEDERDSEECVNDAFWKAWKSIPPQQPDDLFPYLARLCRFTAYDLIEKRNTAKRSALMVKLTREMEECIPDIYTETDMKGEELTVLGVHAYNAFIHRGSVEMYLENADKVEASGNVENQIMENEHIRITLDTVLSDGYTALAIVTLDALDDYGKNFVINHPFIMLRRLDTGEAVLPIGSGGMDDWTEQIKNDSIKYYHEIILSKIDTVCDYEMIFYSDGCYRPHKMYLS